MGIQVSAGDTAFGDAAAAGIATRRASEKKAFVRRLVAAASQAKAGKYGIVGVESGISSVYIVRSSYGDLPIHVGNRVEQPDGTSHFELSVSYRARKIRKMQTLRVLMPTRGDLYAHLVRMMKQVEDKENAS